MAEGTYYSSEAVHSKGERPRRQLKRRSRTSFVTILSLFLILSALKSSFGQGNDHGQGGHEGTEATRRPEPETESEGSGWNATHHHPTEPSAEEDNATQTTFWGDRCIKPAIEQFPPTIMGPKLRQNGGFVFHIAVAAYTFLALAIICDEFFVPSLDRMCEVLKIQPDVAGATFMAAGSSAPELATALIGVFIAKDDIGVSGVIGSAVFNIMFVIAICGLMAPTALYLNWWPLVRDCFFYMLSILALLMCIYDEKIEWYESIFLLLLYGAYCYAMYMNTVLEAWAHTLPIPFPVADPSVQPQPQTFPPTEKSGLVTFKTQPSGGDPLSPTGMEGQEMTGMEESGFGGANKVAIPPVSILSQFNPPEETGFKLVLWKVSLPLVYLFYYTVPDCRLEQWRAWYVITFTMAMVWIAIFSYIMVWMITVVGFTLGIPDTVMGLTFVAAGVSVPDALSSLAVMREGYGDMAVSNAVGSNVFDILICLGLPWFLATVLISPGSTVQVISKGLTYSTLSLLSTVAFLLIATHYNKWQLNKVYGVVLLLWYLLFMILASLYEMNVFGEFNPPECASKY